MASKHTHKARDPAPAAGTGTEEWCLMGPRQLSSHLRYVEELALAGPAADPSAVAQFWRDAREVYRQLEVAEAGAADEPDVRPLPRALAAHQARLQASPALRHTFNTVPVAFGMVELDKLVISQYNVTRAIVEGLRASFDGRPTAPRLAALCLPLDTGAAGFRLAYRDEREFVFVSDAHDMRFLGASVLRGAELAAMAVQGHPQAAVALGLGFSANVLNAIRLGNRLVLNNGHHRAFALRAMGVTHVPCLIQVCASHAELSEAASSEICDNSDLYFESPRPPLLRDFDRPALVRTVHTPRLRRQVRVSFKVDSQLIAD
jgi:hypothetical protein